MDNLIAAAIFTLWILPVNILGLLIIIRLSINIINDIKELRNEKEKRREQQ